MNQRVSEYFAREAGEYLDQLEHLLDGPDEPNEPNPAHLLRLARGVRGSAQMANAETIASVAGRLEDAIRAVTSESIAWSAEIRSLAQQTVSDLKILLRALNRWGPEEESRVRQAIERWDDLEASDVGAGASAPQTEPVPVESLFYDDPGPHILSAEPAAAAVPEGAGVVPIESLLLSGESAMREALALRPAVSQLVAERGDPALAGLLDEVFELVELGLAPPASP